MAVTRRYNMIKMTAANDDVDDRAIIQAISVLPTDAAWVCDIEDGDDRSIYKAEGATKTSLSISFPCGLNSDGIKFKTATNCDVYIYLK